MSTRLEPVRFERHFLEKVWGGRTLARRPGIALPPGKIGETWEVVDREGENSIVATGGLKGLSLRELMKRHGADLLGKVPPAKEGRFPLLVKYIDASESLSVQVHPDDESCTRIPGAEAKTEAWYVVDAQPGSTLYAGLRPDVTAREFERVADGPGVVETLLAWEVRPGDCLLVPGGTVHAISAGITILEVQQNSDTTYRLWDWGRTGRETHVEQALRCIRFGDPPRGPIRPRWFAEGEHQVAHLARCKHFGLNALRLTRPTRFSTQSQFNLYAVLAGRGRLRWGSEERPLVPGDVWLVPASNGYYHFEPEDGELQLLHEIHRP
ncbi:MAG TPA: type I phosphomannose isomerase catalytic subunit [Planctomycetota bacterium]